MAFTTIFNLAKPSQGVYRYDTSINSNWDKVDTELNTHAHSGSSYTLIPLAGLVKGAFAISPSCAIASPQNGYQQYCFRTPIAVTLNEVYGSLRDSTLAGASLDVGCYVGSSIVGTLIFPAGGSHNTQVLTGLSNPMAVGQWSRIQITSGPVGTVSDLNVTFMFKTDLVARG